MPIGSTYMFEASTKKNQFPANFLLSEKNCGGLSICTDSPGSLKPLSLLAFEFFQLPGI